MTSSSPQVPTVCQVGNRVSPKRARTSSSSSCCSSLVSSWWTDGTHPSSSGSPEEVLSAPVHSDPVASPPPTTVALHRKRRRPNKNALSAQDNIPEVACSVCGEPAVGYNFDAITCDSCKIFFRRNAHKENVVLKCINGEGSCQMSKQTRKKCPACRLKRCLHVGMRREWIKSPPSHAETRMVSPREKPTKTRCCRGASTISSQTKPVPAEPKSYLRPFSGDFADSIFAGYLKQVRKTLSCLDEPLLPEEMELFFPWDGDPSNNVMQNTLHLEQLYNQSEVCVRRLVLALKEMPQFSLMSRSSQVTLMKESLRGISTLFYTMRQNLHTGRLEFKFRNEEGHWEVAKFDRQALWKQAFHSLPSSHQLAILQMISMDMKTKLHGANMLAADPSGVLRNFCRHLMELAHFEEGNEKDLIITALCLLRLFQTNISSFSDAALCFEQTRNDAYLIERTHSELKWFITQYLHRQVTSASIHGEDQQEDATLARVLEHLTVLEKVQAHMELFIQREKVTPLMQEFLIVPSSCDLSDNQARGGHTK